MSENFSFRHIEIHELRKCVCVDLLWCSWNPKILDMTENVTLAFLSFRSLANYREKCAGVGYKVEKSKSLKNDEFSNERM